MSNRSSDELSYTTRAALVGAMIGGTASLVNQWKANQEGSITPHECMTKVATDTLKASAISGVTTYTASKMVKQPALSMATILAVGVVGAYLLSSKSV